MFFTVSSKFGLKAELLHFGNMFPSVRMVQTVHTKKRTSTFGFCCQKYAAKNTSGINVLTSTLQQWRLCRKAGTLFFF